MRSGICSGYLTHKEARLVTRYACKVFVYLLCICRLGILQGIQVIHARNMYLNRVRSTDGLLKTLKLPDLLQVK